MLRRPLTRDDVKKKIVGHWGTVPGQNFVYAVSYTHLCYVNSRLVSRGIPVACEVDIYGALSEYIGMCASGDTVNMCIRDRRWKPPAG